MCQAACANKDQHSPGTPQGKRGQSGTQIAMMMVEMMHSKAGTLGLEDGDVSWRDHEGLENLGT